MAWWLAVTALAAGCNAYDDGLLDRPTRAPDRGITSDGGGVSQGGSGGSTQSGAPDGGDASAGSGGSAGGSSGSGGSAPPIGTFDPLTCSGGECWWSQETADGCRSASAPTAEQRPSAPAGDVPTEATGEGDIYLGWTRIRLGAYLPDGSSDPDAWQGFGLDLDGTCTNSADCRAVSGAVSCKSPAPQIPFDGELCRDNTFARLQPVAAMVPEIGTTFGISEGVFNCELWRGSYNLITKISGYNGQPNDPHVRVDFYASDGLERPMGWSCPVEDYAATYPLWRTSATWRIDESTLSAPIESEGSLPDSVNADPDAYVRDGFLVARPPDGTNFRLIGNAMPYRGFPLRVHGGYWIGHLQRAQDGTWTMRDGLSAGRIKRDDLIQGFREVGFCPGQGIDTFYEAMVTYVQENADVLADGSHDPAAECDAMSFGIAFEASQLTPGAAGPVEPLLECCPPGVSAEQCATVCGDGAVTGDEQCDTAITGNASGACPSSCAPLDGCTPTMLTGSECTAHCAPLPITEIVQGDGCCPPGANQTGDDDCEAACGNGVVEGGETCDPAESCERACSSSDACLTAMASGSAERCDLACALVPVTACANGDGCCPDGCTQAMDNDCSAMCGDGFVGPGETCEAGSATPCPASCDDAQACTSDVRTGSASNCNVRCNHVNIIQPVNGDGCCPPGANANNDNDCTATCGNRVVESGERCDGNCPSTCNDSKVCTTDALVGSGCSRRCSFTDITQPANGDGCCPPGANANNDDSCMPVCGNGAIEVGEGCDDRNTTAGDGCANCQIETSEQMCRAIVDDTACSACSCRSCTAVMVNCFGSSNAAMNARCKTMVDCGRARGCSGSDCYCGDYDLFSCVLGLANGPCRAEVEAAAESTAPLTIQERADDTRYALGRANAVAECALASCASACDL
jgi:cysteine-rich repeat protein